MVFGHRCEIFDGCLLTVPLAVHFDKDGTGHNVVGQIEQKHQTDPKLIASNKEVLDKDGSFKAMVDESSTNMFKVVKWWSKNQQNCCLIATKIPHSDIDQHIKPYEEHIEIANPKNPKQ
jgi:hypothetical protein